MVVVNQSARVELALPGALPEAPHLSLAPPAVAPHAGPLYATSVLLTIAAGQVAWLAAVGYVLLQLLH
jgi:hypothetical protein